MATTFKSLASSNLPRSTEATTGASVFMMGTTAPGSATDRNSQWWVPIESVLAMWGQYEDRWVACGWPGCRQGLLLWPLVAPAFATMHC